MPQHLLSFAGINMTEPPAKSSPAKSATKKGKKVSDDAHLPTVQPAETKALLYECSKKGKMTPRMALEALLTHDVEIQFGNRASPSGIGNLSGGPPVAKGLNYAEEKDWYFWMRKPGVEGYETEPTLIGRPETNERTRIFNASDHKSRGFLWFRMHGNFPELVQHELTRSAIMMNSLAAVSCTMAEVGVAELLMMDPDYYQLRGSEELRAHAKAEACEHVRCWKDSFFMFGLMALKQATMSGAASFDLRKEGAKQAHAVVERCVEPERREGVSKQLKRYLETTLASVAQERNGLKSGLIPYYEPRVYKRDNAEPKRIGSEVVLCAMECLMIASKEQKSGLGTDCEFLQRPRIVYNSWPASQEEPDASEDKASQEWKVIATSTKSPLKYSRCSKAAPYAREITGERMRRIFDTSFAEMLSSLTETAAGGDAWAQRTLAMWPRVGEDDDEDDEDDGNKRRSRDELPLESNFGKLSEGPMGKALRHYFVERVYSCMDNETTIDGAESKTPDEQRVDLAAYYKRNVYRAEAGIDVDEDDALNMADNAIAVESAGKMVPFTKPKDAKWVLGNKPPHRLFDGESPIAYIDSTLPAEQQELDCPVYPSFDASGLCYEPYKKNKLWMLGQGFVAEETRRTITYKMFPMGQKGDRNNPATGWGVRAVLDQPYRRGEIGTGAWKLLNRIDTVPVRRVASGNAFAATQKRGSERERTEQAARERLDEALKRKLEEVGGDAQAGGSSAKRARTDEGEGGDISGTE